jgi:uncharacterized membrane protein
MGADEEGPVSSAGFEFHAHSDTNLGWWPNAIVLGPALIAGLWVGLAGPFEGFVALAAAVVTAGLVAVAVFALVLLVYRLYSYRSGRKAMESFRRRYEQQTGQSLPRRRRTWRSWLPTRWQRPPPGGWPA